MSVFPKIMYSFNTITTKKFQEFFFFKDINELIQKGSRISKMTLKKKYKLGGLTLCNFKIHNTATVVKAVGYQREDTHTNQLNETESQWIDT